jgi:hypothetical protein
MGTKRIGLARIEALMENLKREIAGFNVATTAQSVTTITAAGALARNSINLINDADGAAYTLPAASTCSRGDIIIVKYIAAATSGTHKYGTAGEFFSAQSTIFDGPDDNGANTLVAAPNGSSNDFLTLTAVSNGGPGIGTELHFHFDGSKWAVNGNVATSGNGSGTINTAFGDT